MTITSEGAKPIRDPLPDEAATIPCAKVNMDYGADNNAGCGSVAVLRIMHDSGKIAFPDWFTDDANKIVEPTLGGMTDCQAYCNNFDGCKYFAYEYENGYHKCYLKDAYTDAQIEAGCKEFVAWGGDEGWYGGSGLGNCDPVTEAPVTEGPTDPVTEAPVTEAPTDPVTEAPVTEGPTDPVTDAPVTEAPTEPECTGLTKAKPCNNKSGCVWQKSTKSCIVIPVV